MERPRKPSGKECPGQEINPAQINPPNFYNFTGKARDEEERIQAVADSAGWPIQAFFRLEWGSACEYANLTPWTLKRFHKSGQTHFVTFCCYQRQPSLTARGEEDLRSRARTGKA